MSSCFSDSSDLLNQSLVEHGVGDLEKACDVGAIDVVPGRAKALRGRITSLVDCLHDALEAGINLFPCPGETHAVLRHLESGSCDSASVGRLARAEEDAGIKKLTHSPNHGGHVGTFRDDVNAVAEKICCVPLADLILGRARKRALRLVIPEGV